MFCADPSFGLNAQALAILHFLAGMTPSFAPFDPTLGCYKVCIRTFPWYNGREMGVALIIHREAMSAGPCRIIAFGESRNSDAIFVEYWEEPMSPFNGPTIENRSSAFEELAGAKTIKRVSFNCGEVGKASDHIYDLMKTFYLEKPLRLVGGTP